MAKILIADDDVILMEMLRFRFESAGHEVIAAEDGLAALAKAEVIKPDLIVLDSMMPIVSGPEVLARLKANPATSRIPVLMLTARDGEEDVVAALKGGASEYITKPFIPRELLVRVERLLLAAA